ncbi:MAG TPA: hypothetical protein VFS34_00375 [Thermoanaerobaculia bacterium]|nr:hypothetical protein [Thermoanaerobaculia bacterium]
MENGERGNSRNLEDEIRELRRLVALIGAGYLVTVAVVVSACHSPRGRETPGFLTVRGLSVVDANGTVRVRLGAPLPDPIADGRRIKRDEPVSGILICDAAGDERGGYVTDETKTGGNALLTLDGKDGQDVTLVAYPHRGAEIGVQWRRGSAVALRSVEEGSSITILNDGRVSFKEPQ